MKLYVAFWLCPCVCFISPTWLWTLLRVGTLPHIRLTAPNTEGSAELWLSKYLWSDSLGERYIMSLSSLLIQPLALPTFSTNLWNLLSISDFLCISNTCTGLWLTLQGRTYSTASSFLSDLHCIHSPLCASVSIHALVLSHKVGVRSKWNNTYSTVEIVPRMLPTFSKCQL